MENGFRLDSTFYSKPEYGNIYQKEELYDPHGHLVYCIRRIRDIYEPNRAMVDSSYYNNGNMTRMVSYMSTSQGLANSLTLTYDYDIAGRLITERMVGSRIIVIDYEYDQFGRLVTKKRMESNQPLEVTSIKYDARGRIVKYKYYRNKKWNSSFDIKYKGITVQSYYERVNGKLKRSYQFQIDNAGLIKNCQVKTDQVTTNWTFQYFY